MYELNLDFLQATPQARLTERVMGFFEDASWAREKYPTYFREPFIRDKHFTPNPDYFLEPNVYFRMNAFHPQ